MFADDDEFADAIEKELQRLESIKCVHRFFTKFYIPATDDGDTNYLTTNEILTSLTQAFPDASLKIGDVAGWLEESFKREDIGAGILRVVWLLHKK